MPVGGSNITQKDVDVMFSLAKFCGAVETTIQVTLIIQWKPLNRDGLGVSVLSR